MIIIGIGANLPSKFGSAYQTCQEAIKRINSDVCSVIKQGGWYKTSPVPMDKSTPWYINTAISIETEMDPNELLDYLQDIEKQLGRIRDKINDPRCIDIDIIDYKGEIRSGKAVLPHPRMHLRGFVLFPLKDIHNQWKHPITRKSVGTLISELPKDQTVRRYQE